MKTKVLPLTSEFPALNCRVDGKKMVYLDSACTALKMRSAAAAQKDFLLSLGACGGKRSSHVFSREVEGRYYAARAGVADFIGAGAPEEIIFTSGTTEAANILAGSFPFEKGRDEVVLSPLEHNSVFLPFYNLARAGGIKLKVLPLKDGKPDAGSLKRTLSRRTALLCVTRASNFLGGAVDMVPFAEAARRSGAALFSDAAQYLSSHREDVSASGIDALAFSGHKLGAPFGTGALYVRSGLLSRMKPSKVGGGVVESVNLRDGRYEVKYLDNYQGFEAGIQNYAGAVALARTLAVLENTGRSLIRAHMENLVEYACSALAGMKGVRVVGQIMELKKGAMVPIVPSKAGFSVADFNIFLNNYYKDRFIAVRTGRHCADLAALASGIKETIRLSFFIYTSREDIDAFILALRKYVSLL